MDLDALNKYLAATQAHLGIEDQRYGGGFRAIVAHRSTTDFLFDMLDGDDFQGTEAMYFLEENYLFPSSCGATAQLALEKLNAKIGLLYKFEQGPSKFTLNAIRRFKLKAQYDVDPGEELSWYDVTWERVVDDLRSKELHFYQDSKNNCGVSVRRDLHALISFKYEGEFASLAEFT